MSQVRQKIAIYPGSFDPITLGHCNIIERASKLFDRVIVAFIESSKKNRFKLDTRLDLAHASINNKTFENVQFVPFSGLLVEFMRTYNATILIRGLRAHADFEYELQLAHMNYQLAPEIETIFLTARPEFSFVSSSLIKEIADCGGSVSDFVSPAVSNFLTGKKDGATDNG